uniref:BUB1 mitotic checkpoint serine/threonine kinase B n=1 Tax=Strigops habroptila TaxID=2489341 RepID=A0A672TNQ8_STRHB
MATQKECGGSVVMSQDCSDEWELSKENVQPLRQGRVMSTLQEALAQQETSIHTAVQLKKQEFESEIRFYSGDDPLDVWDRYIKWTEQTFPQGGKESNLAAILERAVKALNEQKRYYKDPRYLNLWLKFGNYCNEPLDLYSYLHSQEIGTTLALLYITWAEVLEARGSFKKADLIFQEGLQRKAEPLDRLQSHHRQFQTRVSRQTLLGLEETSDEKETGLLGTAEPQRTSLADLKGRGKKKVRAPISRVGDALRATNQTRSFQTPASQQLSNNPGFAVFDENSASGPEIPVLTPQPWTAPPAPRAKENELSAGPWNSGRVRSLKVRPRSSVNSGPEVSYPLPSFTPYVEESAQLQVMTPCKIEPSINRVLSARKPEKEEDPLQRVQNHQQDTQEKKEMMMYCKDKVYAGVEEFSLEEIRAEIYRKKAKKKAEGICSADHAQKSARRPLAVRKPSDSLTANENVSPEASDELNGIEPLAEDAIVTGSYKNQTICANPEDTCDFVRAAHLASTPFHGVVAQRIPDPGFSQSVLKENCPEAKSTPPNQEMLVCEGVYSEALCVNKLSPIMEASLEDTHSSGGSVSSGSSLSSVTQISTMKYLHIPQKLELAQSLPVYSQPIPWDFYITLQLQERLNADFDQNFSENCCCYLFQDGCAVLHRDINRFTLGDVIRGCKTITEEFILLVVYNLLGVVEKLHKAEIVHGDLSPDVFFLGDRICDPFANEEMMRALKIVDFSHSLDLRLQSRVSLSNSFPISQTPHGQQLLAKSALPYQVDLVAIADIVHLMLFGDHIQVYHENSIWKISQNVSKTFDSDFWSKLLGRIVNADGKSTVPLLRELREEISDMFDSSFQGRLCESLAELGETLGELPGIS